MSMNIFNKNVHVCVHMHVGHRLCFTVSFADFVCVCMCVRIHMSSYVATCRHVNFVVYCISTSLKRLFSCQADIKLLKMG